MFCPFVKRMRRKTVKKISGGEVFFNFQVENHNFLWYFKWYYIFKGIIVKEPKAEQRDGCLYSGIIVKCS